MIQLDGVVVRKGRFQLGPVHLEVNPSEYFVVLGPTGSGKTMLLETVVGINKMEQGQIHINGRDVTLLPIERRNIGFVYQDYLLFPNMTVEKNIAFGLVQRKVPNGKVAAKVKSIAELLGIEHLLKRRPAGLSGGEMQRVALARALVPEPELLLLDEPLSALDPNTRQAVIQELKIIHRELDIPVMHICHDFEEAIALADRIAVFADGRLEQVGPAMDVFRRPSTDFVAAFMGAENVFEGVLNTDGATEAPTFRIEGGISLRVHTGMTGGTRISIRPEDVILSRQPTKNEGNWLLGTIRQTTPKGTFLKVVVDVGIPIACLISRTNFQELGCGVGDEIHLLLKESSLHVF